MRNYVNENFRNEDEQIFVEINHNQELEEKKASEAFLFEWSDAMEESCEKLFVNHDYKKEKEKLEGQQQTSVVDKAKQKIEESESYWKELKTKKKTEVS